MNRLLVLAAVLPLCAGCAYKSNLYWTKVKSDTALTREGSRTISIDWQDSDARVDAPIEVRAKADIPPEAVPTP